jgi:glycosyltransferase involved in cell wall biosynthesis
VGAPEVTVVLATNRSSPYLGQALRSLTAQTFAHWELVVVDDGSPDPEALLAAVAGLPRARVVRQPAGGLASARNAGCVAAAGRLVTFLDDDDWWPPPRLGLQVAALAARADCIGCYGLLDYVDEAGKVFGSGPACAQPDAALAAGFHIGTVMVRRSALARTGWFDPLLPYAEDIDFSLRLGQAGALAYVPERLLYYRRHGANMTVDRRARQYGRLVYDRHLRLARLSGRGDAAQAIAAQVRAQDAYEATEGLRRARWLLKERRVTEALGEGYRGARRSPISAMRLLAGRPGPAA